jgi:DinB superfamily
MPHPLVIQLHFTRKEFVRALKNVTDEEARRHFEPMNCMSWIIGHLAWHEQMYWLTRAQGITPVPEVNALATGQPASTPPLDEMWQAWQTITQAADPYLDTLTSAILNTHMMRRDKDVPYKESIGTQLRRLTYHYWYHTGESQAIRQLLGHQDLPVFVGDIHEQAPYIPEDD